MSARIRKMFFVSTVCSDICTGHEKGNSNMKDIV